MFVLRVTEIENFEDKENDINYWILFEWNR
jgi:hypothetical protein